MARRGRPPKNAAAHVTPTPEPAPKPKEVEAPPKPVKSEPKPKPAKARVLQFCDASGLELSQVKEFEDHGSEMTGKSFAGLFYRVKA